MKRRCLTEHICATKHGAAVNQWYHTYTSQLNGRDIQPVNGPQTHCFQPNIKQWQFHQACVEAAVNVGIESFVDCTK